MLQGAIIRCSKDYFSHFFILNKKVKSSTRQIKKTFHSELASPCTQVRRCDHENTSVVEQFGGRCLQFLQNIFQPSPVFFSITLTSVPSDLFFLIIPCNVLPLYFTTAQCSLNKVPSSNNSFSSSSSCLTTFSISSSGGSFFSSEHISATMSSCRTPFSRFNVYSFFSVLVLCKILLSFLIIYLRMF